MDGTEVVATLRVLQLAVLQNFVMWDSGSKIVQILVPLEQEDSAYDIKSSALEVYKVYIDRPLKLLIISSWCQVRALNTEYLTK